MDYQKTVLNSEYKKIDLEQIGLVFEFKEINNEQLDEMYYFLCHDIIGKLSTQFIMSVNEEMDGNKISKRSFSKNGRVVSTYREGNCTVDAVVRSPQYKNYRSYNRVINQYYSKHINAIEQAFYDEWKHPAIGMNLLHYKTPAELLENVRKIIMIDGEKIIDYPPLYDMEMFFYFDSYDNKDVKNTFFYGEFCILFSGYMLNYEYDKAAQYLKSILKKVEKILPVVTGNIFLQPMNPMKQFPLEDYFREKNIVVEEESFEIVRQERYERHNKLKRVEWVNYIPGFWKEKLDEKLWTDSKYMITEGNNGIFIQMKKPIQEVTINDRLELRKLLNNVMLKGSSLWMDLDWQAVRRCLEAIPVFPEEIHLASNGTRNAIIFLSDNDLKYVQNYDEDSLEFDYKIIL